MYSFLDICKLSRYFWSWDTHPSKPIISHWNLQCASTFIKDLLQSSLLCIGCLFGFSIHATLADSLLGRKNILIFSCVTMPITPILIILSVNNLIYSALKFMIDFCYSTITTFVLVLLTNKVNAEWKFRFGIIEYFTFTMGYVPLPGIAYIN
jgi:hypothetical protein